MNSKSDIYHSDPRLGKDSFESHRACLPAVKMPVARAALPFREAQADSCSGTVIGCPPVFAFGPPQERIMGQANITSWGEAQHPFSSCVTSWVKSQQPSSTSLTSWGESQQTSTASVTTFCFRPAHQSPVSSTSSTYLTSGGETQQTSTVHTSNVSSSQPHYVTSWGESQKAHPISSTSLSSKGKSLVHLQSSTKNQPVVFRSTDIRVKKGVQQNQDVLKTVEALSDYCRQGPGGQLDPIFASSPNCVLCSGGATCLGASCRGNGNNTKRKPILRVETSSMSIPGLVFQKEPVNYPGKTPNRSQWMKKAKCFSPASDIFNYQGRRKQVVANTIKNTTVKSRISKRKCMVAPTDSNILQNRKLQLLLINSGQKNKWKKHSGVSSPKSKKPNRVSSPAKSSIQRKLEISELPCARKTTRMLPILFPDNSKTHSAERSMKTPLVLGTDSSLQIFPTHDIIKRSSGWDRKPWHFLKGGGRNGDNILKKECSAAPVNVNLTKSPSDIMAEVSTADLEAAVQVTLKKLDGITELYPSQYELLLCLLENNNIFYTNSTNSGKTLPLIIYPDILKCLNSLGYNFPSEPKVLFVTALNSLKESLVNNAKTLGLRAEAVTSDNLEGLLSSDTSVLFISPEVLKLPTVTRLLIKNRASFALKCVDEAHLVVNWGLDKKTKAAFRPAMALSTGELSSLEGKLVLLTATATQKTMRILKEQFPEVLKWKHLLNLPVRNNVTIVVPPPHLVSTKFEKTLLPFIARMEKNKETFLVLVRGINKGSQVFLHLLKEVGQDGNGIRQVALYHRNTSDQRKREILLDLQLPLGSPDKKLICVVATVSLGVGVDVRVHHAVIFGLSENAESLLQEGGRPMRGGPIETQNQRGFAFFFHKGNLEAKHCPASSDCRALITNPLPSCQTETILRLFDNAYKSDVAKCHCCYACIKQHGDNGCRQCTTFLETYIPHKPTSKVKKSVALDLTDGMKELFAALRLDFLLVEKQFKVKVDKFIKDFIRMSDEIRTVDDIINIWHVEPKVAQEMFNLFVDIVFGENEETILSEDDSDTSDCDVDSDDQVDQSSEDE